MKKRLFFIIPMLVISLVILSGCTKSCANCGNEIAKDTEVEIDGDYYCEDCVEYCADCNTALVKDSESIFTYDEKHYCKECFEKEAYPIVLLDNDKVKVEITNYDDSDGSFAVSIKNKTKYSISIYQEGDSVAVDGNKRCIAETDGSGSFAYADVPANETATVFSSFRENMDDGWDTVLKMSELHTFEFVMTAWIDDENYSGFWDTNFKVKLTPEMFGYTK